MLFGRSSMEHEAMRANTNMISYLGFVDFIRRIMIWIWGEKRKRERRKRENEKMRKGEK